ncbi:hypothetical protein BD779DRAFT_343429 [Infundibulicybe gibba]|nr:hypothetical protein BD779DRAFT_343429 [Infundibulicybe gibba]
MTQPPAALPTVPAWIESRLRNIFGATPAIHFEHSLYGPLNAYLHTLFPPTQSFMIKPQGMLRPDLHPFDSDVFGGVGIRESAPRTTRDEVLRWVQELSEGVGEAEAQANAAAPAPLSPGPDDPMELDILQGMDDDENNDESDIDSDAESSSGMDLDPEVSRVSKDSYGIGVKKTNKGIRYPDFIIVKATGNLNKDKILLIVEVKRSDESRAAAQLQIAAQLRMAENKHRVRFLQGLLVMGGVTEGYFLDDSEEAGVVSEPVHFFTDSTQLKARINAIVVANW